MHRRHALDIRARSEHFVWTWFTMTMATGGIANVIHRLPYDFDGRFTIGCIFFFFNLVLFICNVIMTCARFAYFPALFKTSIIDPSESLFVPAWLISLGTILLNITEYGDCEGTNRPWLTDTMHVLFWVYCGLAFIFSIGVYLIMWSTQTYALSQMTPIWIFPAYPLLIIGPHAGAIAAKLTGSSALNVLIGGFVLQGIGFMVSLMIYAAFIYRLMTAKLPQESLRPGMFVSVGPSGFTISAVVTMGAQLTRVVPDDFMGDGQFAGKVTMVIANWVGLWLWGLAVWFFFVSTFAHWSTVQHKRWHFQLTWYSYVFPNTALVTATIAIAQALDNNPLRILSCVMSGLLVAVWMAVFASMIRAVIVGEILSSEKSQ